MVTVRYFGRLGNNFFQYAMGRIIAERLGFKLNAEGLPGFPNTFKAVNGRSYYAPVQHLTESVFNFDKVVTCQVPRHIILEGHFQRYAYYKPHKDAIRRWFMVTQEPKIMPGEDDLVVHMRLTDQVTKSCDLPFSYYKSMVQRLSFNRLIICTDDPNSVYVKCLSGYNPILPGLSTFDEFNILCHAKRLVMSEATFSWWAAFLGRAREIYFPIQKGTRRAAAGWVWQNNDIALRIDDESRIKYVDVADSTEEDKLVKAIYMKDKEIGSLSTPTPYTEGGVSPFEKKSFEGAIARATKKYLIRPLRRLPGKIWGWRHRLYEHR
jgi:hypothetical protein